MPRRDDERSCLRMGLRCRARRGNGSGQLLENPQAAAGFPGRGAASNQRNRYMIPAAAALDHDLRPGAAPQVEGRAAQCVGILERAPVDAQHHVAGLDADPLGSAAATAPSAPRSRRARRAPAPGPGARETSASITGSGTSSART